MMDSSQVGKAAPTVIHSVSAPFHFTSRLYNHPGILNVDKIDLAPRWQDQRTTDISLGKLDGLQ